MAYFPTEQSLMDEVHDSRVRSRFLVSTYHACKSLMARTMTKIDDPKMLLVVCWPVYEISSTTTPYSNVQLYRSWMKIDNLVSSIATREEYDTIMRNRTCWDFFYAHLNLGANGVFRSIEGPHQSAVEQWPMYVGNTTISSVVVHYDDEIYMSPEALRIAVVNYYTG